MDEPYEITGLYSQFTLGALIPAKDEIPFQDRRESAQGFSLFKTSVGVATPSETGMSLVYVERATTPPSVDDAVQAVSFPLTVAPGGFWLTDASDAGGEIDLEPGDYDVLVRFFPREADPQDAAVGLRSWKIILTFLPPNTLGARCHKLEHGTPPAELFLR